MNDPEWGFSGCSNIIPYLESQTLIPLSCDTDLTNYGFVNMNVADICECSCAEYLNLDNNILMNRKKINTLSIIGQQSNNIYLQLDIYDDGSVEKKYVIK